MAEIQSDGDAQQSSSDEELAADLWLAVDTKNLPYLESLLEEGADPNHKMFWTEEDSKWDIGKLPPLHRACKNAVDIEIIKALVDGGADLEKGDKLHGMTPLHWACETELRAEFPHKPVVEFLTMQHKCNLDARDNNDRTALHIACMERNKEVAEYLIEETKCNPNLKDNEGETPLDKVLGYTYLDLREDLVDLSLSLVTRGCGSEKDKGNLLCVACYMSKLDVIKELVELHKVEPSDVTDEFGRTPLDRAKESAEDCPDFFSVALYLVDNCGCGGEEERIELLCRACRYGRLDVVKQIIEKHSINPNNVSWEDMSPLEHALDYFNMNYTNYEGCLDTASYLIECGCGDDDDKAFFLLEACRWGNIKYVKELVEKYKISPLTAEDNRGQSALDYAVGNHYRKQTPVKECIDVALYLINNFGCRGTEQFKKLLFEACKYGRLDVVKDMVEQHSINPDDVFYGGASAISFAEFKKQPQIVDYLKSLDS